MTISALSRGHKIVFTGGEWRYSDDWGCFPDDLADTRGCAHCGLPPHPDGRDGCLPRFQGATSVCCGHGGRQGVILMNVPMLPRGDE